MVAKKFLCSAMSVVLALGMSPTTALAQTTHGSSTDESDTSTVQIEGTPGVDYAAGEVLVAVRGGASALQEETSTGAIAQWFGASANQAGSSSFSIGETLVAVSGDDIANATADLGTADGVNLAAGTGDASLQSVDMDADDIDIIDLKCDDVAQTIADLQQLDCVVVAQPSYYYDLIDDEQADAQAATAVASTAQSDTAINSMSDDGVDADLLSATDATSEPFYTAQWSLQNGQSLEAAGYSGTTSLDVEDAWAAGAGNEGGGDVVVAVIDSGVDYTHEDLAANMWTGGDAAWSTALGGGTYGIDMLSDGKSSDPMDTVGHGTHCASTIAAAWNGVGIAGANNKVDIMACRAIPGGTSATIPAYNYVMTAKENGVNVVAISNSWGPYANSDSRDTLMDAVIYKAGTEGIISVFAAGNSGFDNDLDAGHHFNNSNPYLLQVGALNSDSEAVVFSQYGERSVDVFSPGVRVLAATSSYGEKTDASITMNAEYLPWLAGSVGSQSEYFLDDAGSLSRTDGITYDLVAYDEFYNFQKVGDASILDKGYDNAGVNNGQSLKFSLSDAQDAIAAGYSPAIRITIPAATWESYLAQNKGDNLYLSCVAAMHGSGYTDPFLKVWVKTATGWEKLEHAIEGAWDSNWYTLSTKTSLSGLDDGKGENGDVTILVKVNGLGKTEFTSDDYVYLDNVSLGWAVSSQAGTADANATYCYSDGTSMATPNVTGVVSLLCSHAKAVSGDSGNYDQSAATAREVVSFIKGGVTQLDSLSTKCSTGGVANAYESYEAFAAYESATSDAEKLAATASLKPVPTSITDNGDGTSTLFGSFFGAEQGTVTFKGEKLAVTSWTDSAITFKSLAYSKEQVGQVVVSKGNGLSGQGYLILPAGASSAAAFATLPNPDFGLTVTYTKKDGTVMTVEGNASEVKPLQMVAVGGYLYVFGDLGGATLPVLMRYDVADGTWDEKNYVAEYAETIDTFDNDIAISMAAGKTEIYLKYMQKNTKAIRVMTLDAASGAVKYDVELGATTNAYGSLGFLKGELYLVGGAKDEPACSAIHPDTGVVYWSSEATLPIDAYLGNVTSSGFGFEITGSFPTKKGFENGYKDGTRNEEVDIYLPNKKDTMCNVSSAVFFPQAETASQYGLDAGQAFASIGTAGADGSVIVTGPVRYSESDGMVDTWIYNAQVGDWTAITNTRFAPAAEYAICACVYNGTYYVMATDMQQENVTLRFGSFPIAVWGLTDEMVTPDGDAALDRDVADATIEAVPDQPHTGEAVTPALTVTLAGKTLVEGTDYTVEYADNVEVGTATATVTGIGDYAGTQAVQFKIYHVYPDVPLTGQWYSNVVYKASRAGVFSGYDDGTFGPNDGMNRAQLVTALWNYYGQPAPAGTATLTDIEEGAWYADAANWAVEQGVISGYPQRDGSYLFVPEGSLDRDQASVIIANAAHTQAGAEVEGSAAMSEKYAAMPDQGSVEPWAADSVAWCLDRGIISGVEKGSERYIEPLSPVTRAQACAFIVNGDEAGALKPASQK